MDSFEAMHGLAIKKFATAAAVAELLGASAADVQAALDAVATEGMVMAAKGAFMLTPKGQQTLAAQYSGRFGTLRSDAECSAGYARFELVNSALKALITDWQTMEVAGSRVPNDHSDQEYDAAVIDRLGELHERAEPVLAALAGRLSRLGRYRARLAHALDQAESGRIEFVSGAKIDSYHTVWFELHADLLRVLDRRRDD